MRTRVEPTLIAQISSDAVSQPTFFAKISTPSVLSLRESVCLDTLAGIDFQKLPPKNIQSAAIATSTVIVTAV